MNIVVGEKVRRKMKRKEIFCMKGKEIEMS